MHIDVEDINIDGVSLNLYDFAGQVSQTGRRDVYAFCSLGDTARLTRAECAGGDASAGMLYDVLAVTLQPPSDRHERDLGGVN